MTATKTMLYKIQYTLGQTPYRQGSVSVRAETESEALEKFREQWEDGGDSVDNLLSYRIVESVGIEA